METDALKQLACLTVGVTERNDLTPVAMGPSFESELFVNEYLSYYDVDGEKNEKVL